MTSVDGPTGPSRSGQGTDPTSTGSAPAGTTHTLSDPYPVGTPTGPYPVGTPTDPAAVHGHPHPGVGGNVEGLPPGSWSAGPPVAWQQPEPDRLTRFVLRLHARSPRWAAPLAALGCVGAGMAYALVSDPTTSDPDAPPSCLLKLTTGLDCPGCGGTRALWYLLHADLPAAARHHVVFVFAVPFLAYLFVAWAGKQAFGWRLPELRLSSPVIGGFLAVWLAFSVLRNLPWPPFTALYV
ncbi:MULTISPECIES: DUF2752 domain-containing protein [unclassified Micromonospora]|uniref:DUF2752 domain-containing protein n=1 Tax=unclassified Micromonospora TaxID=2617518 RepID=UPI001C5DDD4F|nr:DUF2752 domain-containing protein [Micromonospora sp. RL09-050-HVF-A]MBW4705488.1 DUF2752 domain-containing protein [Micromonospora sp. RL09-050-HVF-A]